jgi:hypothetical protein
LLDLDTVRFVVGEEGDSEMDLIIFAIGFGLIPAMIATRKGQSFIVWWL